MTDNIYSLMSAAPWWRRYTASPRDTEQEYFTTLLFRRDAVASARPFQLQRYASSCMGATPKIGCYLGCHVYLGYLIIYHAHLRQTSTLRS